MSLGISSNAYAYSGSIIQVESSSNVVKILAEQADGDSGEI